MHRTPVGILTHNRARYLNITLRSLSASVAAIERDINVTIFDDGSDAATQAYYETIEPVAVATDWPSHRSWKREGLEGLLQHADHVQGLGGRLQVIRLGEAPVGVVNASCRALSKLFEANPNAPYVVLLQDDIVFQADWFRCMVRTAGAIQTSTGKQLGLLAGIKLNAMVPATAKKTGMAEGGITAQCLLVTRAGFQRCADFLQRTHTTTMRFDDMFRDCMAKAGLWAGCIVPYVCQHFGAVSKVRPKRTWGSRANGRVGLYGTKNYVTQLAVRSFDPAVGAAEC